MTLGDVREDWAERHHAKWVAEQRRATEAHETTRDEIRNTFGR